MKDAIIRTISIKLAVNGSEAVLQATQQAFNAAASWIATVCWDEGITNTNTAHHRVYGETRTRFGLGAQLAICARAKAVEAIKATSSTNGPPVRNSCHVAVFAMMLVPSASSHWTACPC